MNKTSRFIYVIFFLLGTTFTCLAIQERINTYRKQCTVSAFFSEDDRKNSEECRYSYVALGCLVPAVFGLPLVLIGGIPLSCAAIRNYRYRKLIKTGTPIATQFSCVRVKKNILVNKHLETASVIVSQYQDPMDATKTWEFESPFIWTDRNSPEIFVPSKRPIIVYVNPLDYTKYAMDISELLD